MVARPTARQVDWMRRIRAGELRRLAIGRPGRASYVYGAPTIGQRGPTERMVHTLEDAGWIDWSVSNTAFLTYDGKQTIQEWKKK